MLKKNAVMVCSLFASSILAQLEDEFSILQKNLTTLSSALTKPIIGGEVYTISNLEELNSYISKYDRVILDIYKDMCNPCRAFAPIYEKFAKKHPEIICLKVEGKKAPDIEKEYQVTGYPTIVLFKNKTEFDKSTGASRSIDSFEARIKNFLRN